METTATKECIESCLQCYQACTTTAVHSLTLGGEYALTSYQTTLNDCALACRTAADFMLRESPMQDKMCLVCAEACDACAEACAAIADEDQIIQDCSETCRNCAEMCQDMANA